MSVRTLARPKSQILRSQFLFTWSVVSRNLVAGARSEQHCHLECLMPYASQIRNTKQLDQARGSNFEGVHQGSNIQDQQSRFDYTMNAMLNPVESLLLLKVKTCVPPAATDGATAAYKTGRALTTCKIFVSWHQHSLNHTICAQTKNH